MNLAYKKILGKFTKVLGFGKTPPMLGKIPKWYRVFFESVPNTSICFIPAGHFVSTTFGNVCADRFATCLKTEMIRLCLEIVQVLYAPLRLHRTSFSTFMSFNYKTSSIKSKCHKLLPLYEAAFHRPLGGLPPQQYCRQASETRKTQFCQRVQWK